MPFDPQLLAAGSSRRNVERNRPAGRGHVDARSGHGLAQRDRQADEKVVAPAGEERMRGDVDRQHQVAGGATAGSRLAFAAEPHLLSVFNARRNLDHDRFRLAGLPAEAQLDLAAADGGGEGDGHFGRGIAAAAFRTAAAAPAGGPAEVRKDVAQPSAALPEAFAEELAEVDIFDIEPAARPGPPSWTLRGRPGPWFQTSCRSGRTFPAFPGC